MEQTVHDTQIKQKREKVISEPEEQQPSHLTLIHIYIAWHIWNKIYAFLSQILELWIMNAVKKKKKQHPTFVSIIKCNIIILRWPQPWSLCTVTMVTDVYVSLFFSNWTVLLAGCLNRTAPCLCWSCTSNINIKMNIVICSFQWYRIQLTLICQCVVLFCLFVISPY